MNKKSSKLKDEYIINKGLEVLDIEAQSISHAKENIDISFAQAVKLILACKAKVIISGLGKSGLIAKKIAATFASLGTPSSFVHPGDALHGDLGMISEKDLIIMISNSGETDELISLQWFLEEQGNASILISGNKNSTLAKSCTAFLNSFVQKEACNHNLAPTSSTTVSLAIGDALAVTVSNIIEFKISDFVRYHPAGKIGRLHLKLKKVRDIMRTEEIPICREKNSVLEVISIISKGSMGVSFMVDNNNRITGIITDGDLRRGLENKINLGEKASLLMTKNPKKIAPLAKVATALDIMQQEKISVLPVTENDQIVGAIQLLDCQ